MVFALEWNAFRFYADDGGEDSSTALVPQDTNVTVDAAGTDTIVHLRLRFDETGGTDGNSGDDFGLEFRKNEGSWLSIKNTSSIVKANGNSQLVNNTAGTNRATEGISDPGGSFVIGRQKDVASSGNYFLTNHLVPANEFTEHTYGLELVSADLSDGDTLDFRIVGVVATGTFSNNVVPRITIGTASGPLNLNRISSMHFMRHYEPISMGE